MDIEQYKNKYGARSIDELVEMLSDTSKMSARVTEMENALSLSRASLADIENRIRNSETEHENLVKMIASILKRTGTESEEAFRLAVSAVKDRAVGTARSQSNLRAMEAVLAGDSFEQLQAEAEKARALGIEPSVSQTRSMDSAIEQSADDIVRISGEIANLRTTIAESENTVRPVNEIVEEMVQAKARIADCENDLKSYSLAIEKIESLSSDIHHTFADAFNGYVSNMMSEITKGKYDKVRVNDNMQIKVEDRELGQLVDISSLSGGTIDQLYFCVRFAIMDLIIKDKKIPVFLDDCMLQYDDTRLSNILNLLYEKSQDRQILIFSCRKAEKLALDEKGYY